MKGIKEYCAGAKGRQRVSKEKNMSYYNVCEHCGSNLDPGEKCDCMEQQEEKKEKSPIDAPTSIGQIPDKPAITIQLHNSIMSGERTRENEKIND